MKTRARQPRSLRPRSLRLAAPAAVLSALLLVSACGGDDSDPDPDPTPSETAEDEETGLSKGDLEDALLTEDDVADLASDIEEVEVNEGEITGDDIVDGDEACAAFLDDDYGIEEEEKAETEFESEADQISVYSTIESYAEGEAAEELEATRDLFSECSTFTVDLDGQAVTVDVLTIDISDLDGYDLGDEGLAVDLTFSVEGAEVLRQGYTLVRIDDVLTISGAATVGDLGDDIMLTITEAAVDRLQTVLDDAA
ncbi:hypothetical protein [Aeromicrobium sp. Leaf350]|uniref:hypothetical protein n=1 Tax=Aeromicrobium sp. Leaf350 TaxID=2876565 RepID=UPI001E5B428F|nr:hypothetical protein [Aeromicrobium sp. Leaf350]